MDTVIGRPGSVNSMQVRDGILVVASGGHWPRNDGVHRHAKIGGGWAVQRIMPSSQACSELKQASLNRRLGGVDIVAEDKIAIQDEKAQCEVVPLPTCVY